MEIIPAVLPETFEDLEGTLSRLSGVAPLVQIDVVDGIFAPNRSWPYSNMPSFEPIAAGEKGLPLWEEFEFEVDIMAARVEKSVTHWLSAGASRIIIHVESQDTTQAVVALQGERGGALGLQVGLALSIETPLSALEAYAGMFDYVQLMGIARIGFQGETLDERVYERIASLRALHPDGTIQIDGGVKLENAPRLKDVGANRLVAGSAILGASNPRVAYRALTSL